jgi:hypothetical protein
MALLQPLWQQAGTYPAAQDRRLFGALWPTGGTVGMAATWSGTGMVINISAGVAAVPDANVPGACYVCPSDAQWQVTLQPAAAQDRIDIITVQPRDSQAGGSNNDWIFNTITGAPAASPVAPAIPAGQLGIVQIRVVGGAATIAPANMTDLRGGSLNVSSGPPSSTQVLGSTQSFTDAQGEVWVSKAGVNGGAWRKARDVLHSRGYRAAALSLPAGTLNIPIDGVSPGRDPYGMLNTSTGVFIVPVPGFYLTVSRLNVVSPSAGQWIGHYISINGASSILAFLAPGMAVQQGYSLPFVVKCAAGDTLGMSYNGNAVQTLQNGDTSTWMEVHYFGTG